MKQNTIPTLRIRDFPQLAFLCWSINKNGYLREDEALSLYERNWRFVDQSALENEERELINRLVNKYGNGVLHV